MTAYTAEILNIITARLVELDQLVKDHAGTKHEYALNAGMFELMSLSEKVQMVMAREKRDILARKERDLETSWRLSPDKSGGAYTAEEIAAYRDRSW